MDGATAQIAGSLGLAVRTAVALILAGAGAAKLRAPGRFRSALSHYRVVPAAAVPAVAQMVGPAELALAMALVLAPASPLPAVLASALLLLFAGAIAINLRRGRTAIDCGCSFGRGGQPIHAVMVSRNLLIAAALLAAAFAPQPRSVAVFALAVCAGAILFLLYCVLNQIVASGARLAR